MNDMKKRALVFLADGSEEIEAVTIIDVLRRGGVEVVAASATGKAEVLCSRGVRLVADAVLPEDEGEALRFAEGFDAVALPGGMGGTEAFAADARVLAVLRDAAARGAVVSAVCAAPMVLDAAGLLAGRRFCCYPGIEKGLSGAGKFVSDVPTAVDGNVVTGTGPGTAALFAAEVLRALGGPADAVAEGMLLPGRPGTSPA